jgi:hypothetical protein
MKKENSFMKKHIILNIISTVIFWVTIWYIVLIITDNPTAWIFPEFMMFCIPLYFIASYILALKSVRIQRTILGVIMKVISIIAIIITLVCVIFLILLAISIDGY